MNIFRSLSMLLCLWTTAVAADDLGPEIGTVIPHELRVSDQDGVTQDFSSLTGKNGLVLVFVRSAKWCPYCKNQLKTLQEEAYQGIKGRGYNLVSISYDSVKVLTDFSYKTKIKYPMLSDEGSAIIKAFGVLNDDYKPDSRMYGIPRPIIIVTDASGVIKAKLYEEGYKNRPAPEVILDTLASFDSGADD